MMSTIFVVLVLIEVSCCAPALFTCSLNSTLTHIRTGANELRKVSSSPTDGTCNLQKGANTTKVQQQVHMRRVKCCAQLFDGGFHKLQLKLLSSSADG